MALHYILPGRYNLPSLLLTFILYLGAYRIAQSAPLDVTNLTTVTVTETSFTVSWTNSTSENITDYRVIVKNGAADIRSNLTKTSPYTEKGLLPGVAYNVTILTIDNSNTSSPGSSKIVTTLPSSVTGFQVTAVWTNQMNLSWTIPNDVNKYTYNYFIIRQPGNTSNTSSSNTILVPGLSPGTNYNFTIFTLTQDGTKSQTYQQTTNTTKPSVVTNLGAASTSNTSVTLTWKTSPDPNSGTYTYTVDGGPSRQTDIKLSTTEIKNLTPGTEYNFTVFAVTSNGIVSSASNVFSVTTQPSPVTGLTVSSVSSSSVTLTWTSPDAKSASYNYTVNDGSKNITVTKTNTAEIKGLNAGTEYSFTVYAVTTNGISSASSNVIKATTQPSTVTNVQITSVSNTSVTLKWTPSSDPNKSSYTYTVKYGSNNKTNITESTTVITGLDPGTGYSFTVNAVTSDGTSGNPSIAANTTTQPSPVTDLKVSSVSSSSVTLTWTLSTDTNGASYNYTVNYGTKNKTNIKTSPTEITGLAAGTEYSFTIYAVTTNGVNSNPSNVVKGTTEPSIVLGVYVLDVSKTTVTLGWNSSKDTNYKTYTYTVDGKGKNFSRISSIQNNSVVVTNLLPGVDYSFTVSAVTQNNVSSQPSELVNATTMPSTVTMFVISDKSNDSVTLKWTFPDDINNRMYTYIVEMNGNNQPETSNNLLEVKNLKAGEIYFFTIYTFTRNGVKSLKYPSINCTTQPNAPNNLQGNAVNISEIDITWVKPEDVNVNFYDYHVTWQDTTPPQKETTSDTTKDPHFSIKNLLPGHLYNIIVTSVINSTESVNAQIFTATKSVTTEKLAFGNVTNTSVTLTWQNPNTPGSLVSGYRVTVYVNGNKKMETETDAEKYVVDNLDPGNIYNITVESFSSNPKPVTTNRMARADTIITSYSTPRFITVETNPDPVSNLRCSKVDAYQIKVSFTCPAGNFSSFDVLINNKSRITNPNCTDDIVVSNLQPAASYKISVKTMATKNAAFSVIINCETDNVGVIVGSIFGVLLFLLLIAVIAFFVLKTRRSKDGQGSDSNHGLQPKRYHTIPKNNFKQHYENNHADSDFGFADEYQSLNSVGTSQSRRAAELPDNRVKNRFTNVLPYDHSRVKLSVENGTLTSDYVNANYMPGYNSTKEFIASQGPLPNTTPDFWRMVWEHQVNTIVMLTNCMENGRVKCEHYWPLDYTPCTYGDIAVTVTSETILSEWTIRDFSVKRDNQPGIKYVRHFHFTAWPDHGVPESTSSIIQFRNLVREHMDQHRSNGPTVVHCSAGVGRTGTLIAIDYLIQQIEKEQRIGVYGFVEKMRMSRNLMVQTEAQYVFLNKCILDLIDQPEEDPIYENQTGKELVYENFSAIRNNQIENA